MATLLVGLKKLSDDDIKALIAQFRVVGIGNAVKHATGKFLGSILNMTDGLAESVGIKKPFAKGQDDIRDDIEKEIFKMTGLSRPELDRALKVELMRACQLREDEDISWIKLLNKVSCEAARYYGIDERLPFSSRLDEIASLYNKDFLLTLHRRFVNQSQAEIKAWDTYFQKQLDNLDMDIKRELARRLFPKEFSGPCISRIFRLEKGITYIGHAVTILGLEVFDKEKTCAETALYSPLKIRAFSRSLMANLIYRVRFEQTEGFGIDKRLLPSYVAIEARVDENKRLKNFQAALARCKDIEAELDKNEKKKDELDGLIADLGQELEEARLEIDELEKEGLVAGSSFARSEDELEKKHDELEKLIDSKQKRLRELALSFEKEEETSRQIDFRLKTALAEIEPERRERVTALHNSWIAFFYKLDIGEDICDKVVCEYSIQDRILIESVLKEVNDSEDYSAFDNASAKEGACIEVLINPRLVVKIEHEARKIIKIS